MTSEIITAIGGLDAVVGGVVGAILIGFGVYLFRKLDKLSDEVATLKQDVAMLKQESLTKEDVRECFTTEFKIFTIQLENLSKLFSQEIAEIKETLQQISERRIKKEMF